MSPSPSSCLCMADFDVTPGSIGASQSSMVASSAASLRSGRWSAPPTVLSHITRRLHDSVLSLQPSAARTPISLTPYNMASTVSSGVGWKGDSRSTASPTHSCRRATTALLALAHEIESLLRHSASARHPGRSPSGSRAVKGTGAARRTLSFLAPPPTSPDVISAIARTSARASGSDPGTDAAPTPPESWKLPPLLRLTPTRSGYATASKTPASFSPSPKRKSQHGPHGSPPPTPGAHHSPPSSAASTLTAFRSWETTLPASLAAFRSISNPRYPPYAALKPPREDAEDEPPPAEDAAALAAFAAACTPPPAGLRPFGAPLNFPPLFFPLGSLVPIGTRTGAAGSIGAFGVDGGTAGVGSAARAPSDHPSAPPSPRDHSAPSLALTSAGASLPRSRSLSDNTAAI